MLTHLIGHGGKICFFKYKTKSNFLEDRDILVKVPGYDPHIGHSKYAIAGLLRVCIYFILMSVYRTGSFIWKIVSTRSSPKVWNSG